MRGVGHTMSLGERIAFYRVRRDLSQRVLAERVGRSENWLWKVETGRIGLDRLSVIRELADVLDVALGDLLAEPGLLDWTEESGTRTVPGIRAALTDCRRLAPFRARDPERPDLDRLARDADELWTLYQQSRYGRLTHLLPDAIRNARDATLAADTDGEVAARANTLAAYIHQVAAVLLTKFGEADLAWLANSRGLEAAQAAGDPVVVGSLLRNAVHVLSTDGDYAQAAALAADAAGYLDSGMTGSPSAEYVSIFGCLHLIGGLAAARHGDRERAGDHLADAHRAAEILGGDANHVWTAFGPTNVAIHRVAVALELDDIDTALGLGPRLDTTRLPVERRVRHAIETARAYAKAGRTDEAIDVLLAAERIAPEQIHHHRLTRLLVGDLAHRARPGRRTIELAHRMKLLAPRQPRPTG